MKELRLEVTDELMEKIEEVASVCLVTPEHYATSKLSQIFRPTEPWGQRVLPLLVPVLRSLAETLENLMASQNEPSSSHDKEA